MNTDEEGDDDERRERMRRVYPVYVLSKHLSQRAIERAQEGDYAGVASC